MGEDLSGILYEKSDEALRIKVSKLEELTYDFLGIIIKTSDYIESAFANIYSNLDSLNSRVSYLETECKSIESTLKNTVSKSENKENAKVEYKNDIKPANKNVELPTHSDLINELKEKFRRLQVSEEE